MDSNKNNSWLQYNTMGIFQNWVLNHLIFRFSSLVAQKLDALLRNLGTSFLWPALHFNAQSWFMVQSVINWQYYFIISMYFSALLLIFHKFKRLYPKTADWQLTYKLWLASKYLSLIFCLKLPSWVTEILFYANFWCFKYRIMMDITIKHFF